MKKPQFTSVSIGDPETLCDMYGKMFGRKFKAEVIISIEPEADTGVEITYDYFNIKPI